MIEKIVKTEVTNYGVKMTLDNGVDVHISSNKGYLHVSFSGTGNHVIASIAHHDNFVPKLKSSNYLDISYKTREEQQNENQDRV